jgi:hypothetical protein
VLPILGLCGQEPVAPAVAPAHSRPRSRADRRSRRGLIGVHRLIGAHRRKEGASATTWPEADGPDEAVDLAIALPVDDAACFSLSGTAGGAGQARTCVAVLDHLDVAEVPRQAVQL